jgi:signal transduction histidine kinase
MENSESPVINITTGTDLAFALVVFLSYFTTFSQSEITSIFLILILICLGIAYITVGIYGFSFISKSKRTIDRLGYFLLQLVIGGFIVYYTNGVGVSALILLPLVSHSTMLLDQDWLFGANAAIIGTYTIATYAYNQSWQLVWSQLPIFFVGQVFILIFTQMALTEREARMRQEKLLEELAEANRHLNDYANQVKELTLTQERNRMAREIHDGLGHYLTTLNMQIKAAEAMIDRDHQKARHMLSNADELSTQALVDVRNSVFALRVDETENGTLEERIRKLIQSSNVRQMKIDFVITGEVRYISPQSDLTLFRACQEGINNAMKHSDASLLSIELSYEDPKFITLVISDNGSGAEELQSGFGLIGIRERVKLLNGSVDVNTSPGVGFTISMRLPG